MIKKVLFLSIFGCAVILGQPSLGKATTLPAEPPKPGVGTIPVEPSTSDTLSSMRCKLACNSTLCRLRAAQEYCINHCGDAYKDTAWLQACEKVPTLTENEEAELFVLLAKSTALTTAIGAAVGGGVGAAGGATAGATVGGPVGTAIGAGIGTAVVSFCYLGCNETTCKSPAFHNVCFDICKRELRPLIKKCVEKNP